jgi:hypothetical protein
MSALHGMGEYRDARREAIAALIARPFDRSVIRSAVRCTEFEGLYHWAMRWKKTIFPPRILHHPELLLDPKNDHG